MHLIGTPINKALRSTNSIEDRTLVVPFCCYELISANLKIKMESLASIRHEHIFIAKIISGFQNQCCLLFYRIPCFHQKFKELVVVLLLSSLFHTPQPYHLIQTYADPSVWMIRSLVRKVFSKGGGVKWRKGGGGMAIWRSGDVFHHEKCGCVERGRERENHIALKRATI